MTKRNPVAVFFLTIFTLGIYGIYWWITTFNEARKFTGDNSIPSGGKVFGFLFIPFFNIVWGLMLIFSKVPYMVNKVEEKAGKPKTELAMFIVFGIIPVVNCFYMPYLQSRLNNCI